MALPVAQAASFINPTLAAAAVVACAAPIIIHLLNRHQHHRVAWAAMEFLLAAQKRNSRRLFAQSWLLLLLRVMTVLLFGLALARPMLGPTPGASTAAKPTRNLILIDNSLSTSAITGERQCFEEIHDAAVALAKSLPSGSEISLITTASLAESVTAEPFFNIAQAQKRIAELQVSQRSTDTLESLRAARSLLLELDQLPNRPTVHLISDFPASEWNPQKSNSAAELTEELERLAEVANVSLLPIASKAEHNVAVSKVEIEDDVAVVNRPVRFAAHVTSFSSHVESNLSVEFVAGESVFQRVNLPSINSGDTKAVEAAFTPTSPGTALISARISGPAADPLSIDNERRVSVLIRDPIPALLVDGRPGATSFDGQTGYLKAALAPDGTAVASNRFSPIVVAPSDLANTVLSDFDIVALCNIPELPEKQWRLLSEYVDGGGGLIIFAGDLVDIEHYNRLAGPNALGLLPGTLENISLASEEGHGFDASPDSLRHACVEEFAPYSDSSLMKARIGRYLSVKPADDAQVVLSYDNQTPAVVAGRHGTGRLMFVTTTANTDWTNLPAKGDYVSLMHNLFSHLARRSGKQRTILVGQSISEPIPPASMGADLSVRFDEQNIRLEPSQLGPSRSIEFGPVEKAGNAVVSIGDEAQAWAINTDISESDLRPALRDDIVSVAGPHATVLDSSQSTIQPEEGKPQPVALWLLIMVGALLIAESWLANSFHKRGANSPTTAGRS